MEPNPNLNPTMNLIRALILGAVALAAPLLHAAVNAPSSASQAQVNAGQRSDVFVSPATLASYSGLGGAGDVVGPASATGNAFVIYDSTTGKLVKNSAVTLTGGAAAGFTSITAPTTSTLTLATLDSNANIVLAPHGTGIIRASAQIQASDGNAGNPSYSAFSRASTGMYFAGGSSLYFATNGVAGLGIDALQVVRPLVGVTLPSTATGGIRLFNTADETTNTENIYLKWSSNFAVLGTENAGSGTQRVWEINNGSAGNWNRSTMRISAVNATDVFQFMTHQANNATNTNFVNIRGNGSYTASSGVNRILAVSPIYNTSGTAAATDFQIQRTETALGSGAQYLIQAGTAALPSLFTVSNTGAATFSGGINTTAGLATGAVSGLTRSIAANTSYVGTQLYNSGAASAGNQMWAPAFEFVGRGWKTDATAASQLVQGRFEMRPVQGAAAPSGLLATQFSINGGAYSDVMTVSSTGALVASSYVSTDGASGGIGFTTRGMIRSNGNGIFVLYNEAWTDFGRLQFGGTTSSFPAIKRITTGLQARLADDSANTFLEVAAEAYDATGWDADLSVPTKDDVRDKIEPMVTDIAGKISTGSISVSDGQALGEVVQTRDVRLTGTNSTANTYVLALSADATLTNAPEDNLGKAYLNVTPSANGWTITGPATGTFKRFRNVDATYSFIVAMPGVSSVTLAPGDVALAEYVLNGGSSAWTVAVARLTDQNTRTTDSPQFAGVNVGHATDTTITRTAAGSIAVEGNAIYRAGNLPDVWMLAVSDETTDLTTGTAKITFRAPYAATVTGVRASVNTVSSSGVPTFDINEGGTTIMTTNKLTIDASELTSVTAATAAGVTDTAIADDASMTIDIDTAGTGAKGAKVYIYVTH